VCLGEIDRKLFWVIMETILSSGFFWGLLSIAFVAIVGFFSYRHEKTNKKQASA
jgi:hypothetical protein